MRLSWNEKNSSRRFDEFEIRVDRNEVKSWFTESDAEPTTITRVYYRLFRCSNRRRSIAYTEFANRAYLVEEVTEEERELFQKWFEQETRQAFNGRQ